MNPSSIDELHERLIAQGHIPTSDAATVMWLALSLQRPVLVEGPPGVGKTSFARALAQALLRPLIRLQCYEGLDESRALFEWDYGRQMLAVQLLRERAQRPESTVPDPGGLGLFDPRFLLARPGLRVLQSEVPTVFLVDEIDRAEPELEALLLEMLEERQITIPELGTVSAASSFLTVLTSNGTRDLSDALRRRCLYLYVDYPNPTDELAILTTRVPDAPAALRQGVVDFVTALRSADLRKAPSVGEAIEWLRALMALGRSSLDAATVDQTMGLLAKFDEDRARIAERARAALP